MHELDLLQEVIMMLDVHSDLFILANITIRLSEVHQFALRDSLDIPLWLWIICYFIQRIFEADQVL